MEHIESLSEVLRQLLGNEILPNATELLCIYGRMLVNAFNVLDQEMNSIGTAIYLGVSITDHNCAPNAVATFEGTTIYIRLIKEIPILDWSKVNKNFQFTIYSKLFLKSNSIISDFHKLCGLNEYS